jgi:hypothetical protein
VAKTMSFQPKDLKELQMKKDQIHALTLAIHDGEIIERKELTRCLFML